jgi:hypothetical protein
VLSSLVRMHHDPRGPGVWYVPLGSGSDCDPALGKVGRKARAASMFWRLPWAHTAPQRNHPAARSHALEPFTLCE